MIPIAAPVIEGEEIEAVNQVLKSGMLAQGPKVAELEDAFAKYCGTEYAVALNSGTAAIHTALYAAGVGPGDEVITTPFTFVATLNPVLMIGATLRLVDIDPDDFTIDVQQVSQLINEKTKAIIGVDLYGQPYDYEALVKIAQDAKVVLIEDACQSIGATYGERRAGDLGDIACFSLYATKNIMSGEGGVMTTNNKKFADRAKQFRQHGMVAPYEYADLGFNYRMTDLVAAIGVEQVKKVDVFTTKRQHNAALLSEGLADVKGLVLPSAQTGRTHVYHQYTVRVTPDFPLSRDELAARLKEKGVGAGIYYPKPLHYYPHIAKLGFKKGDFPVAEAAAEQVLSLPVHPKVTDDNVQQIVSTIKELAGA